MKGLIVLLLIALSMSVVASESPVLSEPDFAWGGKCSAKVNASLVLAHAKWRETCSMPKSPECLRSTKQTLFDEKYLRELLGRADQEQISYNLLDTALAKVKSLDECKALYADATKTAGSAAPESAMRFDDSYYLLRSRIKLAAGLARSAIARQMTGPETSSYCFQAMESGIDTLRDAADDAQKVPGGAKRAECVRKLRSILFDAWERAQRSKDTNPISEIDLTRSFDDSGLLPSSNRAQSRL